MTLMRCARPVAVRALRNRYDVAALRRCLSTAGVLQRALEPRLAEFGRVIETDYANLREKYQAPKNPIILAHGLFGFDELRLAGPMLPGIQYWRGIREALAMRGIEVITASVPPSGSIEERGERLRAIIAEKAAGKSVNIIAHSMGNTNPEDVNVLSLTTIATPHRGSEVADYVLSTIGTLWLPRIYKILEAFGMETGAFSQLSAQYMREVFNPKTIDVKGVKYYSYGAAFQPSLWSMFRQSHAILHRTEGANDGLVSVESSKWGEYKGTLVDVSHLGIINWTNRLRWWVWELTGHQRNFNAIAFYLDICDMLAKEGL
ncbi:hypothetical protein FH972_026567 [Carpinus fangiana]|uniref:DUF676 domain-containing protein n=1 Tax=Carpinus fangiana TaxID=176857 RepID=A0A5N6L4E4_9ROSI|nr:hypothetical protein FH972_026567 [Carpinus fangiana]